jgi:hypothetical protein
MNNATRLGDPRFWCPSIEVGGLRLWILSVNWQESSAHRNGMTGYTVSRIEVPREDVVALLPRALVPVSARGEPGKRWLEAEVKRRAAAGDVPERISDFSRDREQNGGRPRRWLSQSAYHREPASGLGTLAGQIRMHKRLADLCVSRYFLRFYAHTSARTFVRLVVRCGSGHVFNVRPPRTSSTFHPRGNRTRTCRRAVLRDISFGKKTKGVL